MILLIIGLSIIKWVLRRTTRFISTFKLVQLERAELYSSCSMILHPKQVKISEGCAQVSTERQTIWNCITSIPNFTKLSMDSLSWEEIFPILEEREGSPSTAALSTIKASQEVIHVQDYFRWLTVAEILIPPSFISPVNPVRIWMVRT